MSKLKVLIFSDCFIYGGSEKLMAFLLKNEILNESFDFLYAYRKHQGYEAGLENEKLLGREGNSPLMLLSNETLFHQINNMSTFSLIKKLLKLPFFLFEKIKIYFVWNLAVLIYLLLRTKPDLIHVNNGGYPGAKSCNILVVANRLTLNRKLIYQVNNQARASKGFIDRLYDKLISKGVSTFLNASNRAKEQLIHNRDFDGNKIFVLNNCVTLPKITKGKEQILQELGVPVDSFLIVEVAFLSQRKGQKYLIAALADLFKKGQLSKQKVYCALVGNGEDEGILKSYIEELDLNANVFLLGYRNNSDDFIAECDLFVLPSIKDEDMPLVLLSALGYGKPIISTNFAGIAQVIQSDSNGVLIDNNMSTFTNDLSKEILRLFNNDELRLELGRSARSSYFKYSPESYGITLKSIYEKVYKS